MRDSFLQDLKIQKNRIESEKEKILKNMIRSDSPTHLMIALNEHNITVGMTYFNEGTGYSCGGNYLWMNCVYVKPHEQKKGVGYFL